MPNIFCIFCIFLKFKMVLNNKISFSRGHENDKNKTYVSSSIKASAFNPFYFYRFIYIFVTRNYRYSENCTVLKIALWFTHRENFFCS